MPDFESIALSELLVGESQTTEYKSSKVSDADLRPKISQAASAFWNSGGGVLLIGVNDSGQVDGGISDLVGRTSRADWIQQVLATTKPLGPYKIRCFSADEADIKPGLVVVAIEFGVSHLAPHMAMDAKYYLRSGAHTAPCPHFVVEAMFDARSSTKPALAILLRHSPRTYQVVQIGLCCLNSQPAIDVNVTLDPPPAVNPQLFPRVIPVVSLAHPFFFDVAMGSVGHANLPILQVFITYRDVRGNPYALQQVADLKQAQPSDAPALFELEAAARQIAGAIQVLSTAVGRIGR